ncbi:MAG: hypothetical protein EOO11_22980, partial [Chitinophagaceae bacterium]
MRILLTLIGIAAFFASGAQTSWKGTSSSSWSNSLNWTNGVPNSTKAAVLGDDAFSGPYQPAISSRATCAGLTIGERRATTLSISKNLSVLGSVQIYAGSGIASAKSTISLTGNWTNNGTYSYSNNNATVIFAGTAQAIGGGASTTFRKLTVNASSVLTVNTNTTVINFFSVSGTVVPAATVAISGSPTVGATGTLKVTGASFGTHYTANNVSLAGGSTVEYTSAGAQTVLAGLSYSTLRITGSGTRTLTANASGLNAGSTAWGNVSVEGGTLDLQTFTL